MVGISLFNPSISSSHTPLSDGRKIMTSACFKEFVQSSRFESSSRSCVDHACSSIPSSLHASTNNGISLPHVTDTTFMSNPCLPNTSLSVTPAPVQRYHEPGRMIAGQPNNTVHRHVLQFPCSNQAAFSQTSCPWIQHQEL